MKNQSEVQMTWDWVEMCRECISAKEKRSVLFGLHCVGELVRYLLTSPETSPDVLKIASSMYYPTIHIDDQSPVVKVLKKNTIKLLKHLYKKVNEES